MSDTFFQSGLGGGGGSNDFVKDSFLDTTLAATNNTGLGSSLTTNPLGFYLANTDVPLFRHKTLMFSSLTLIEDRSLWINGNATYEIGFDESFPGVRAYATGSPRISKTSYGTSVNIQFTGDIVGLTGKCVRMGWVLAPTQATGTAKIFTDGTDTTRTATFGPAQSSVSPVGYNTLYTVWHQSTNETDSLHDFQLRANEYGTLNVVGVIVYFENASTNAIVVQPGTSYVDKTKVATTTGSTLAVPSATLETGYRANIYKTSAGTYGVTTVTFGTTLTTFGNGANGGTSIDVTTGTGASFPVGTGLVGAFGTSYYVGSVTNVSTDTLTVTPALPFGFSGQIYRAWRGGQSLSISGYTLDRALDMQALTDPGQFQGIGWGVTTSVFWQDRKGDVRIWGQNIALNASNSIPAIGNVGGTLGILQIDGTFAAMGIEIAANGFMSATMSINGIPSFNVSTGATGAIRKTVMTSGPGFKSVRIAMGSSNFSAISKIDLYRYNDGVTFGLLASFDSAQTTVPRYTPNATMISFGPWQRIFADTMFFAGPWDRQANVNAAGGIQWVGSTTTCTWINRYIGSDYGHIGHGAGASLSLTLNGNAVGSTFGILYTGVSHGFQTLSGSVLGGTVIVQALDVKNQNRHGELKWARTTNPTGIVAPKVFNQTDTPRQANDGDVWLQKDTMNAAWLKAWGRWIRIMVADVSDDPNAGAMWMTGGSTSTLAAAVSGTVQAYNFNAWSTAQPTDSTQTWVATGGESAYQSTVIRAGGQNSAGTTVSSGRSWNKVAHADLPAAMPGVKSQAGGAQAYGYFYHIAGFTTGDTSDTYRYNGAWATATANSAVRRLPATGVVSNIIYSMLGRNGVSGLNTVDQRNSSDAVASATNTNVNTSDFCTSAGRITDALMAYVCSSTDTARIQTYNGSAFSSTSFVASNAGYAYHAAAAGFPSRSLLISVPGENAGASATSNLTNTFNGIAVGTASTTSVAVSGPSAGAI